MCVYIYVCVSVWVCMCVCVYVCKQKHRGGRMMMWDSVAENSGSPNPAVC